MMNGVNKTPQKDKMKLVWEDKTIHEFRDECISLIGEKIDVHGYGLRKLHSVSKIKYNDMLPSSFSKKKYTYIVF